jgi:hypothetical protein
MAREPSTSLPFELLCLERLELGSLLDLGETSETNAVNVCSRHRKQTKGTCCENCHCPTSHLTPTSLFHTHRAHKPLPHTPCTRKPLRFLPLPNLPLTCAVLLSSSPAASRTIQGCSSSVSAEGLLAGSFCRHSLRKRTHSGDRVSGQYCKGKGDRALGQYCKGKGDRALGHSTAK